MAAPTLVRAATASLPGSTPALGIYTLATPAAGTDWTLTIPTAQIWTVLTIKATLVTSATVTNRTPNILYAGAATTFLVLAGPAAFPASTSVALNSAVGTQETSTLSAVSFLLPPIQLQPGFTIGSVTDNLQAGDQWSGVVVSALVYT